MAVDEPNRLGRVEARHHHVLSARVHHREPAPEGRDVEEGEGEQVAVRGAEVHRGGGLEVGGDDVGVGEHGSPRDHVDRRGGNDRERVVVGDLGTVRGLARGAKPVEPDPPLPRLAVDLGPESHLLEPPSVRREHLVVRLVDDEGTRPGTLAGTRDLARRQPPVERVGDDSLAGAGEVELEIGRGVLGDDEHPVPLGEPRSREPHRKGVHPVPEGGERERVSGLRHERGPAGMAARVAGEEVVDGKALSVHGCVVVLPGGQGKAYHRPGVRGARPRPIRWPLVEDSDARPAAGQNRPRRGAPAVPRAGGGSSPPARPGISAGRAEGARTYRPPGP